VYYAFRGYFSKLQDDSLAIRNAATILFKVLGGKENIDTIWPLIGEENEKPAIEPPTQEFWDLMKAKQALIDKQIASERLKDKN